MSWLVGAHVTLGGEILFRFSKDKFRSSLEPGQVDSNGEVIGDCDMSGSDTRLHFKPFFLWESRDLKYRLEIPLVLMTLCYDGMRAGSRYRRTGLYPEIVTSFNWRINYDFSVVASAAYRHTEGGFRDFIDTPLYTSYRTLFAPGNGRLSESDAAVFDVGVNYRNIVTAVFASVKSRYSYTRRNSTVISQVSDELTASGRSAAPSTLSDFSVTGELSKRLAAIRSTFKLSASWSRRQSSFVRNSVALSSVMNVWHVSVSVGGSWFGDLVDGDLRGSYISSLQTVGSGDRSPVIGNLSLSAGLSVFPVRAFELFGLCDYRRNSLAGQQASGRFFADAGVRYRMKKWDFELRFNNITGQKTFSNQIYDGPDYISYVYRLRPFETLVTVRMTF